jgi:hypothetical protein
MLFWLLTVPTLPPPMDKYMGFNMQVKILYRIAAILGYSNIGAKKWQYRF